MSNDTSKEGAALFVRVEAFVVGEENGVFLVLRVLTLLLEICFFPPKDGSHFNRFCRLPFLYEIVSCIRYMVSFKYQQSAI